MAQNLDLNINVNTDQAGKSVGSLKTQLREAQAEVVALSDKFGATSKEAIEAAKRAGELKDRIGDARAMTEAFNPDAKFKAVTASLSGVAGGFAAVQGAMGLLGGESEDVQKMLLKVQSAMAISQGLQSVGEAVDSFKNLGAVIKSTTLFQQAYNFVLGQKVVVTKADVIATEAQTVATVEQGAATVATTTAVTGATTAMKAFRVALIASGIGLLIIAIGLAVQAFSNYVGAAAKAEEAQNKLNKQIADGAKTALDAEQKFLEGQEKLDIARAKAKGASEQEIFEIEQKYRKLRAESHQRHYEEVYGKDAKAAEESSAEINKINTDGQIAALENEARKRKEYQERKEKEEKEAAEKLQKDLLQSYEDYLKRREFARKNSEGIYIDDIRKFEQEDANERDKQRNDEIEKNVIAQNKALNNIKLTGVQILEIDQANSDARKKITEEERNLRVNAAYDIADATMALGSIMGEQTKAGKALGVAGALINTYVGASEVIRAKSTLPEPFGTIQKIASVAAIIATGLRAVKSITSVQVPGGGGGGGASVPSISTQAPIMPQLPSAQMTQLNQQSINDLGNQAVRAYVIETDVTGNQQRMAAIRQRARFS
jgi:hypothetical protein